MTLRLGLVTVFALPALLGGQGHGPVFALSTPTLARGGWSLDVTAMGRTTEAGAPVMLRPMLTYGLTEDLQLAVSAPLPVYRVPGVPGARGTTRMPAVRDIEATLGWRFHRRAPAVGTRAESTAYAAISYPLDDARGGFATAPAATGAFVTGYASRRWYFWLGGLYQRSLTAGAEVPGALGMSSLAVGWRPPGFRADYPRPDWRLFLEIIGEWQAADRRDDIAVVNTGARRLLMAPTVLGLYGWWGVAGGPAIPVAQYVTGTQPAERVRWVVNVIVWF